MLNVAEGDYPLRERGEHKARWLTTVDEAYAGMQSLVDAATSRVCLEMYIYRADGPGERLREALLRAQQRGVQVDVLLDAFGSEELPGDYFQELSGAGGRVRRFNPLKLLRLSFRNHRKLLACDGRVAIVGGFNVGPEYEGDGVTRGWCDIGLYVEGPVVRDLEASFDDMVRLAPFTPGALTRYRHAVREARSTDTAGGAVRLLVSGPAMRRGRLSRELRLDLQSAKDLVVVSGYFLPPWNVRRALRRCLQQGGRVRLLLAGRSDVPIARLAAERLYPMFLRAGAEVHEYRPQILHAKMLALDNIAYVGSCNLDRRSLQINCELLLRLDWPELADDARRWCEIALSHSRRVRIKAFRRRHGRWRGLLSRLCYELLAHMDPVFSRRRFRALS